jgi:hypothetical protein
MKIISLITILLFSFVANILAAKTITCKNEINEGFEACKFTAIGIGPNETVSIETDPADLNVNAIRLVEIFSSSIYSVPKETFSKFPEVTNFYASGANIQEIKPDTFLNGKYLEVISLYDNELSFLHVDTFKGMYGFYFISNQKLPQCWKMVGLIFHLEFRKMTRT